MKGLSWLGAIIVGGLAGWIAAGIMDTGTGLIANIVVGIVGGLVGNWLLGLAGINLRAGSWLSQGIAALVGALFLIWIVQGLA
ncbi:GlsB/YeaQ/YmgE family stress response membrane protein [Paracoccus endophyticus]|uniref:GlsB/YeaQ/YmgE family stress response membrane protein n=1 Tax=Paracoccus endophyticus TaxID=2233774 RepID=UPI000DD546AC|nr:GlsB/YeaQ/YmgE family stress response membrane protein [Paracoccus endophyticus]